MGFDKEKVKQIRGILILTAVLIIVIKYSGSIIYTISAITHILMPFAAGGAIAFIVNIPMSFFERILFGRVRRKFVQRLSRPASLILSIAVISIAVTLVISIVIPQLVATLTDIVIGIPGFVMNTVQDLERQFVQYPQVIEYLQKIDFTTFDWKEIMQKLVSFFQHGFSTAVNTTVIFAGQFFNAVVNSVIAIVFALYILMQKEKLSEQTMRLLNAYLPRRGYLWVIKTSRLLSKNFRSFITGQCVEAVIIGIMFIVTMSIMKLPYPLLIGIIIAFTALIPIVGAFIGCTVSALLILMVSPMQAIIFVIVFLVIQQIEGNLIYPKVVGSSVGLPAIWVLLAVTVGSGLMGLIGMLTFIPLMATVYALIRDDVNARNKKKGRIK